ncbi:MAG: hypothetical protein GY827_10395 [Cytophagales bacterium]|nr:hypothetical protein [Cytophagales bacterium]
MKYLPIFALIFLVLGCKKYEIEPEQLKIKRITANNNDDDYSSSNSNSVVDLEWTAASKVSKLKYTTSTSFPYPQSNIIYNENNEATSMLYYPSTGGTPVVYSISVEDNIYSIESENENYSSYYYSINEEGQISGFIDNSLTLVRFEYETDGVIISVYEDDRFKTKYKAYYTTREIQNPINQLPVWLYYQVIAGSLPSGSLYKPGYQQYNIHDFWYLILEKTVDKVEYYKGGESSDDVDFTIGYTMDIDFNDYCRSLDYFDYSTYPENISFKFDMVNPQTSNISSTDTTEVGDVIVEEEEEEETNNDGVRGKVSDVEGNSYETVQIGEQIWMAENLRTTKYNNGQSIEIETDNSDWNQRSLNNDLMCFYDNNTSKHALYNFRVATNGNVCPTGWSVPTKSDWETFNNYTDEKNNDFNFNSVLEESRSGAGFFYSYNASPQYKSEYWWSRTGNGSNTAYANRHWSLNGPNFDLGSGYSRGDGNPIRCIKD